ncbi:MAG TPA: hypothetical protein VMU84_19990 [Thermoanaerobaculia bacterium]|nr:hypothetical protein [Thermoanaerobaculia bacterium]
MKYALAACLLIAALPMGAQTIGNDNSCDISVAPAATLLLPYFEADLDGDVFHAINTVFAITNVSPVTQIARVTLWTDLGYPVVTFNLILTGYDVQSINLRELLTKGVIGAPRGYFAGPYGSRSIRRNPKHGADDRADCFFLPTSIPQSLLADVRAALTGNDGLCRPEAIRGEHLNAIGYATIDVVATCANRFPNEAAYYTTDLLFDNVLIGDWTIVNPNPALGNYAGGSPLVHIRAIPEGFLAGDPAWTNLPHTFYESFTPANTPHIDRRQPLPSTFAARYIEGGISGFVTDFFVWRQSPTGGAVCDAYYFDPLQVDEVVKFDERENPFIIRKGNNFPGPEPHVRLPLTSRTKSWWTGYPQVNTGDIGGWMYFNLASPKMTQAWVVSLFHAEGRYAFATDAAALGNGCSPPVQERATIGPAGNGTP